MRRSSLERLRRGYRLHVSARIPRGWNGRLPLSGYSWMMPRRTAIATAAVRSLAPSFSMMCLTWTLTVSSEIEQLLRDVVVAVAAGDVLQHVDLAFGQALVRDVLGELRGDFVGIRLRPACTWRIASTSSFGGMFFNRYPRAPAASERWISTSPSNVVSITIRASGNSARIAISASIPLMSGMPEIHQRHVGPVLAEELNRVTAGRRLRDHRHVGLAVDDGRDPSRRSG